MRFIASERVLRISRFTHQDSGGEPLPPARWSSGAAAAVLVSVADSPAARGTQPVPGLEQLRALEGGVCCRVFRMRRPNWKERSRYGLDRQGNFRPELYLQYRGLDERSRWSFAVGASC